MFCKIINFSKREVKKVNILRSIFVQKVCSKLSFFTIVVDNIEKTIIYTKDKEVVIEGGYLDLGINDTMKDLMLDLAGAVAVATIGCQKLEKKKKEGSTQK